jgi:hypothetical protein
VTQLKTLEKLLVHPTAEIVRRSDVVVLELLQFPWAENAMIELMFVPTTVIVGGKVMTITTCGNR